MGLRRFSCRGYNSRLPSPGPVTDTMPLQNRVTPHGEIIADPARGLMMGNRGGRLHTTGKTLSGRRWTSRQWICCQLTFNGRHREVMSSHSYTELFFLDEATAFAAGHRPCFECRREAAQRFVQHWTTAYQLSAKPRAGDIDRTLHAERIGPNRQQRTWLAEAATLPSGVFVTPLDVHVPFLLLAGRLLPWTPAGYQAAIALAPAMQVRVLTPASITAVLNSGYQPLLHGSARDSG